MAFGLTIGTERATALQNAIQDELMKRGFSPEADPVMAEYITIMIINNKTPAQISSELEDLIGSDFDTSFVDWLFAEAAKGAPESEAPAPVPVPAPAEPSTSTQPPRRDSPPHQAVDAQRRPPSGPRAGAPIYSRALHQAVPSTSPSAQKRTASARSPSPSGPPSKSRRTDLPTGPRAMLRDGPGGHGPGGGNGRSLLDRVGPARSGHGPPFNPHDDVQARIDSITNGSPDPNMMMMNGAFPMNGMPGMDMAAMSMANPMMLQELMMNQMAMMSQIAGAMGILPQGQFMNGAFPPMQPGMGGDMGAFNGMPGGMPQGGSEGPGNRGRGRGRGGPTRGAGRGRGGHVGHHTSEAPASNGAPATGAPPQPAAPTPAAAPAAPVVAAPTPIAPSTSTGSVRAGFVPPERPQSPTLCKFSLKCTNPLCRYSHPSPVATPESGVVLSNDACEKGKDCKDKDCIKAHVSPAVLNPNAEVPKPSTYVSPAPAVQQNAVPCRYGASCTRPGCTFAHPARQPASGHFAQPCRFGAGCTRATCPFQHPEGRVLPTTFHRGLATTGGMVNVPTPETGSMGAPSPHKSMQFNRKADGAGANGTDAAKAGGASSAADLEKKVKEMEDRKNEAQKAIAAAQAGKKDDSSKPVPISA
ncbi:hypothetical protein OH77DRAFT_1472978 [Trametes cingulata]|nr:hypothetical protein OH77DRAFT_1472978 [Trametes cingulata]